MNCYSVSARIYAPDKKLIIVTSQRVYAKDTDDAATRGEEHFDKFVAKNYESGTTWKMSALRKDVPPPSDEDLTAA